MSSGLWLERLPLGPMDNFVWLFGAEDGRGAAVVDAAWDVEAILQAVERAGRRLEAAFVTHGHHDHVNGLPKLLARVDLPVFAQQAEVAFFPALRALGDAVRPLTPDATLEVAGLTVRALATPGHTPGSQCLHLQGAGEGRLFTGDTLFVGACGRCDLGGGDAGALFDSLQRLRALPATTDVLPGHDYGDTPTSTLAEEVRLNPYLAHATREAFVAHRLGLRRL